MASPPFSLSTATPGDSDIVSQFPLNERTLRDIIQSWISANHDSNGNHVTVTMPYQGSAPSTPAASIIKIYASANGRLQIVNPDATVSYVGLPPGSIIWHTGGTPNGFLVPDGSAVSRTTFADLFAVFGITFGAGNGSTTFNLPDLRGRVVAAEDPTGVRLTSNVNGFGSTAVIGVGAGNESQTLSLAQLPTGITSAVLAYPNNNPGNFVPVNSTFWTSAVAQTSGAGTTATVPSSGSGAIVVGTNIFQGAATSNNTSGTSHPIIQPTIILRALIKI